MTPEQRKYHAEWSRQHRAQLRGLPMAKLRKLRPTVYVKAELTHRARQQEIKDGLRLGPPPGLRAKAK
jgi:hypothetical protein